MEFMEVVSTRRSIRSFQEKTVSDELLENVVRAGMMAPSAGNQQPWEFVIIREKERLAKIPGFHPYAKMAENAPAAIVLCGAPEGIKYPTFWPQDCSAAAQNMLLAARDCGLGSVWAGIYPEESRMKGFRELCGIPQEVVPFALIVLGWPNQEFKEKVRFKPERIRYEQWQP